MVWQSRIVTLLLRARVPSIIIATAMVLVACAQSPAQQTAQSSLGEQVHQLSTHLDVAKDDVAQNRIAAAENELDAFAKGWQQVEPRARVLDPGASHAIDQQLRLTQDTVSAGGTGEASKIQALNDLDQSVDALASHSSTASSLGTVSLTAVAQYLSRAQQALQGSDAKEALAQLAQFEAQWPLIEGQAAQASQSSYRLIEQDLPEARADLSQNPPQIALAATKIDAMVAALQQVQNASVHYGPLDAAFIVVREGLEAILVLSTLLAFLRKANIEDKARWVWGGGLLGLLASLVVALLLRAVFAAASLTINPELLEGATGVLAAVMLLYMSWWMHDKARIKGWQNFLRSRSQHVLQSGRMAAFGILAFLAVFREGGETLLFYVGIAPAISQRDLLLGIGLGMTALTVLAIAIIGFGIRLPIRAFFTVASALVYYLALKFLGLGLHSLQLAGLLPASPAWRLPTIDWIGFFPSLETALPQLLVVLLAVLVLIWSSRRVTINRTTS
ncbi:MAG: FTR1 family protein [Chloroflexi bacterium]|nr:FTR1 family protein [Chloroflexota bacterium]